MTSYPSLSVSSFFGAAFSSSQNGEEEPPFGFFTAVSIPSLATSMLTLSLCCRHLLALLRGFGFIGLLWTRSLPALLHISLVKVIL